MFRETRYYSCESVEDIQSIILNDLKHRAEWLKKPDLKTNVYPMPEYEIGLDQFKINA